ncbi:hypothetical protein CKA32_000802 [Geitlerinema sp. FC II]|nr:hypothetical protein CKA32_000802 [Geitlerinema sp. FC II]
MPFDTWEEELLIASGEIVDDTGEFSPLGMGKHTKKTWRPSLNRCR